MSKSDTAKQASNTPIQWVNLYLDDAQKTAAGLWCRDYDTLENYTHTLLSDGYTFSSSFNEETDSFIITLFGKKTTGANKGYGTSTHGGSWLQAMQRALYKHFIVCECGSWHEFAPQQEYPRP